MRDIKKLLIPVGQMFLLLIASIVGIYSARSMRSAPIPISKLLLILFPYFFIWTCLCTISFMKYGEVFDLLTRRSQYKSDFHYAWNTKFVFMFLLSSIATFLIQAYVFDEYYNFF